MSKRRLLLCLALLALHCCASPAPRESDYVRSWCAERGKAEVVLQDGSRVDCLTPEHAVEFDFSEKWAEAVGQSLHYARLTGLKPGIVLILKGKASERELGRLKPLAEKYGITLWVIE